jgi:hypothetical protein
MRWAVLLGVLVLVDQDKSTLEKALKAMDDWKSYHYRIGVKNLTSKKDESKAGEFIFPKIITLRKSVLEIAKRGDKCMVNQGKGYKPLEEITNASIKSTVAKLEPPHRELMDLVPAMEKVQKEKKDEEFDGKKCRVYHSAMTKDAVQKYAGRFVTNPSGIDWSGTTGGLRIYVSNEEKWVRKIVFTYTIKTVAQPPFRPAQTLQYEEEIEFFTIDTTRLELPQEVKDKLEILD